MGLSSKVIIFTIHMIKQMMNKLAQMRNYMMLGQRGRGTGRGLSASASASANVSLGIDSSNYDALIISKQREIVRLVAENGNSSYYDKLIRERQKELDELVDAKKSKGKSAAFSDAAGLSKLKELRRYLLA